MEFDVLLRLVDVMNLVFILACPFIIQGKEPNFDLFWKENFNVG